VASVGASTARVKVGISPMRSSPVTWPASERASSAACASVPTASTQRL
jgi:hypothetical protein